MNPVKQLLQSEAHPFMLANLDGVCNDPIYGDCIFEAKTASAFKANELEGSIPDEYMLQIQHYMAVTGYRAAYIAVLISGNTFRWRLVERDEELIAMLIELEKRFWEYVKNGTPPIDGSEACAKYLAENELKQLLGNNEIGTIGSSIVSWKNVSPERLNTKTLKSEHPTLYKKYTNKTSYRCFSVKSAE